MNPFLLDVNFGFDSYVCASYFTDAVSAYLDIAPYRFHLLPLSSLPWYE